MTTTQALGTVAVGYDGTPQSDVALAWAVRYAEAVRRPLLLVHAAGVPSRYVTYGNLVENRKELRVRGRQVLDQGLARARALSPTLELREHLTTGTAREVLLDSLIGAHLLVLGSRGHGRLVSFVLGSVSTGVSVHAPCPVVVVREPERGDPHAPFAGHVVVGVDGAESSQATLDTAFEYASFERRPLAVLHSWGISAVHRDLTSYEVLLETAEEHELQVAEVLAGFAEKYPDVAILVRQVEDDPAHALVEASHDAEVVVVGSRHRSDAAAVLFGSVSRYVVQHARCPVMVARTSAPVAS